MSTPRLFFTPLMCVGAVLFAACANAVEPGAAAVTTKSDGLVIVTERSARGLFPHQMLYLLLQR